MSGRIAPPAKEPLTSELMLHAYAAGIFPMAESRDSPDVVWVNPMLRGVMPLGAFHMSRSLRRRILRGGFEIRLDHAFDDVVTACAARDETWINPAILATYADLHALGHAHSVEVWQDGRMVGGIFGIAMAGAFFGESMFSRITDGSKIAMAWLVDRLRLGGFTLFDTQFLTPHLASLGGEEIPRADYLRRLNRALGTFADFRAPGPPAPAQDVVQRLTQTS
jgi:leucyl/phenylalanyl-tRNA---protein transferase